MFKRIRKKKLNLNPRLYPLISTVFLLLSGCSSSHFAATDSDESLNLNLIGPVTVYSDVCSVFMVSLSKTSDQSYSTSLLNLEFNLSSSAGGFFTTDSHCSAPASTVSIPSGEGFAFIYYKHSQTGHVDLSLIDPFFSFSPVNKQIQIASPGQSGSLDTTFGKDHNGKVTLSIGENDDELNAIAVQPDGKIVGAGYTTVNATTGHSDFVLIRYNTDGSQDTTFGVNGIVKTQFGGTDESIHALAIQPDGKIIAAGNITEAGIKKYTLVRYHKDGSLDQAFGREGIVKTTLGENINGELQAIKLQSDGKIIVAGHSSDVNAPNIDFALVRYHSDGSLDTSYGEDHTGIVRTPIGSADDKCYALAIQSDGKIIAGGHSTAGAKEIFALARYNRDGTLDQSFGENHTGKITKSIGTLNSYIGSLVLQLDGKIIALGGSSNGNDGVVTLIRYHTDGSVDQSFGNSNTGIATSGLAGTDFGTAVQSANLDPYGNIITSGSAIKDGKNDFFVMKFNSNGILDSSFGEAPGSGIAKISIGTQNDTALAMDLQPDGKIVVAGSSQSNQLKDNFALIRLWP